jgi:hypothetical protein
MPRVLDEQWLHSIGYAIVNGEVQRDTPVAVRMRIVPPPPHDLEEQEQRALLRWVETVAIPQEPRLAWLYHVPNGGKRGKAAAGRLKAMGARAGVPDLHLPVASRGYHGTWLELKAPGKYPSPAQQHWLKGLAAEGHHVGVYTTWVAAAQHLCWYLERDDLAGMLNEKLR